MFNKFIKTIVSLVLVFGLISMNNPNNFEVSAMENEVEDYLIYPVPHTTNYTEGSYILSNTINVVLDDQVDEYTINRLKETLALKDFTMTISDEIKDGMTNIVIGVLESNGSAEKYIKNNYTISESLFEKTDSYYLVSDENVIAILGRDEDSSFYGLTTLYHIFAQLESLSIRNFVIEDYADVVSRGFIEGYYGNPWSTEDRVNLMEWGGYYKLNSYFYAPKDDPKHNSKWRELYTDEEIENSIKPLAEAGNKSKNRFVYALHPYMNSPIRYNNEENYQADLKVMQDKFKQVIDVGVRQISILADDAGNVGGANYIRTLEDMTEWLKEQQEIYPDLKLTLPFVTQEYMGWGENYYSEMPDNIQIVMTGGRVWGEVSKDFTESFTNKVGRGPYMWINWPCTDNSKQHLIMGGFVDFLHTETKPGTVEGIVLNPMQQSEPSKVAIFGNAAYSWNMWETKEEADQAWIDSFSFVDHNNAVPNAASNALYELSKHMINQNMDGRVRVLDESIDLKEKLNPLKTKLTSGTLGTSDLESINDLISEFKILEEASKTYRTSAGNMETRDQMVHWLNSWDDTTNAALTYLEALKSIISGDVTKTIQLNSEAKVAFEQSKTYGFHYVDHTEYAEVGVQHIVPFIKALDSYVSKYVESNIDPNAVIKTFITSRTDTPVGDFNNVFDESDSTQLSYRNPVWVYKDDYVGVTLNKSIEIQNVRFLLGNGKNHIEKSKLQYTVDGTEWLDIPLVDMNNEFVAVRNEYLEVKVEKENLPNEFKAKGLRLIATEDNKLDAYLNIHDISFNNKVQEENDNERITGTIVLNGLGTRSGSLDLLQDGNYTSEVMLAKDPYSGPDRDSVPAGTSVEVQFDTPQNIGAVKLVQGKSAVGDVITDADLQYKVAGSDEWKTAGKFNNQGEQTLSVGYLADVIAVRILNNVSVPVWWRLGEIEVLKASEDTSPISYSIIKTDRWFVYRGPESNLYDGDDSTMVWYDPDGASNSTQDIALAGDYIGYDLGKVANLKSAHIVVGNGDGDKLKEYAIETSFDNVEWNAVNGYDHYVGVASGKDTLDINLNGLSARYIRIKNLVDQDSWIKFSEFTVEEMPNLRDTSNVYTNTNANVYSNALEEGVVSLSPVNTPLNAGDYVGIKLDSVSSITAITTETLDSNFVLETAIHPKLWSTYDGNKVDAKYIRVRALNNSTLDLSKLSVEYEYIAEMSVTSNFANQNPANDIRTSKTLSNVFDNNILSSGTVTGPQQKGQEILFDLGQQRKLNSLRYYIDENSLNYPRAVDFLVSDSLEGEWHKIMHIGPEDDEAISNVWDSTTAKSYEGKYLTHDSSNPGFQYSDALNINKTARYIKIVPTQTYAHRWLTINELQINGGEYVSSDSTRDIITTAPDVVNQLLSSMIDGNYSTSYKANVENESFSYRLSQEDMKTARIIQNGIISNAAVSAKVFKEDGTMTNINLGILSQAINEFALPQELEFVEITISWDTIIPEIAEIATSKAFATSLTKDALQELIDNAEDTSLWTTNSKEAYDKAYVAGEDLLANEYVTQNVIDATVGSIKTAIQNKQIKGDADLLRKLVDEKVSKDVDGIQVYTTRSFDAYDHVLNTIKEALKNADSLSQEDVEALELKALDATNNLVYSLVEREIAQSSIMKENIFDEQSYTELSYTTFINAKKGLEEILEKDMTVERVNPLTIHESRVEYQSSLDSLVDVRDLKELMKQEFVEGKYTSESWSKYQQQRDQADLVLIDGTEEAVLEAIEKLTEAIDGLKEKELVDINDVIKEMELINSDDYTEESYAALKETIEKAKQDLSQNDETINSQNIEMMNNAKEGLVSTVSLNEVIEKVNNFDEHDFTTDSYTALLLELEEAKELLVNGTQEEITKMIETLETLIDDLIVNAKGLEEYQKSLSLKDESKYTEETYKAYLEAYTKIVKMEIGNTSVEDFNLAKEALELAEEGLVINEAQLDYTNLKTMINLAKKYDESVYTEESFKNLKDALSNAERLLTDDNVTQEDIDKMVEELQKAMSNLKVKQDVIDPKDPEDTKEENKDKDKTPPTGVMNGTLILYTVIMASLIGLVLLRRKKMIK